MKNIIRRLLTRSALIFVILLIVVLAIPVGIVTNSIILNKNASSPNPTSPSISPVPTGTESSSLLPGQKIWKNGVSSYLFGSNDSVDWSADNFVTDPHHVIQASLKFAHFTLMREFIFHYDLNDKHRTTLGTTPQIQLSTTDPHEFDTPGPARSNINPVLPYGYDLEKRLEAIENSGMQCLIVLPDILTDPTHPATTGLIDPDTGKPETDLDFARRVVAYAGNRCDMYEIGNEPDLQGISITTYLARWNEFVPILRKINPNARFFGPVTYSDTGVCKWTNGVPHCYMTDFLQGAKASGVIPDGVTFHQYPCSGNDTPASCLTNASSKFGSMIREVKGWVRQYLGVNVPVGITEWNMDPGSNQTLGNNAQFMGDFSTTVLNQMISNHLDFANQFDTQDYGGYCVLDMFNSCSGTDQPKTQFDAIANIIKQYIQ